MQKFPIAAFYKNIIFTTHGRVFAAYQLPTKLYRFFNEERKLSTVGFLKKILSGFSGKGQILLLWKELELNEGAYLKNCIGAAVPHPKIQNEVINHARAVRAVLSSGARIRKRYILLELKMKPYISDLQDFLTVSRDAALKALLRVRPMEIPDTIKQAAISEEEELYLSLRANDMKRIHFDDLDFMIRRVSDRVGVLPAPLPERKGSVFTPAAIAAFTDGTMLKERIDHVRVIPGSSMEEHYQSYVHFVDMPKRLPPTGLNVFEPTDLSFPFDAVIHFEITPSHTAERKVEGQKRMLTGQIKESLEGGGDPGINEEGGLSSSRLLQANLEAGQPLASLSVCLAVGGRELKKVRSNAASVCQKYLGMKFRTVCPVSKQMEALYSFLPGAPASAPTIECDPGYIAAMGPHFESALGDPTGFFMGWSGQIPVFFSPGRPAMQLQKTNAILITGTLGGGKSVLAKDLADFVIMMGGYVIAVDPKAEYHVLKDLYGDLVRIIDFSPRGNGVAFSPFVLSQDEVKAKSIALNYLTISLYAIANEARRMAISQALGLLYNRPVSDRHMDHFSMDLSHITKTAPYAKVREQAEQCVFLLNTIKQTDVGRTVFGNSMDNLFEQGERVIILSTKELPRPSKTTPPSEYTEEERQGMAILYLLAAISREAAFGLPRHIIKLRITDEAWTIAKLTAGERLIDEEILTGRSFNLISAILTQNITDVNKSELLNNISQIFCFRAEDSTQVQANLQALGADIYSVRTETFAGLNSGTCLHRDAEGRIGWLEVDLQPEYLLNVFGTTPGTENAGKEGLH